MKSISQSLKSLSDWVWISDEEIQQWQTTKLYLKYKKNNHRAATYFKKWTLFELNQNLRTISVTNLNQDQLESHQKKETSSANILVLLNIWIKKTSIEKDESEETLFSLMKIQCKAQAKFKI